MSKIQNEYDSALLLAHHLIGGKWRLRLLWHINRGDNRFSVLLRVMPDISQKVLMSQLQELEKSGIIIKQVISNSPPKVTLYSINEQYNEIIPIIEAIFAFTHGYAHKNGIDVKA